MFMELIMFLGLLLAYLIYLDRKPANMPPGPGEIPFIGNEFISTYGQLQDNMKKYGKIYATRFGKLRTVVLNDFATAKMIYANPNFQNRPAWFRQVNLDPELQGGVIAGTGAQWVHDRRLFLRAMRDNGMGKSYFEDDILLETRTFIQHVEGCEKTTAAMISKWIKLYSLNIVWKMVTSKRYDYDDEEVNKIQNLLIDVQTNNMGAFASDIFPIIKYIPSCISNAIFGTQVLRNMVQELGSIIQREIEEHEESLDPEEPRDLLDECLLGAAARSREEGVRCDTPIIRQLVADTFITGGHTTSSMLAWVLHLMVRYPDKTRKCQAAIDAVVPPGELPRSQHRQLLPYLEAYVAEVQRVASLVFIGGVRCATQDTTIHGFFIPKDSMVLSNTFHFHHDPLVWENPEAFMPERFLRSDGSFNAQQGYSLLFSFGAGYRQCPGESLARTVVSLMTGALLKTFDVALRGREALDCRVSSDILTRAVRVQDFVFTRREGA